MFRLGFHSSYSFSLGLLITSFMVLLGVFAPIITKVNPQDVQVNNRFAPLSTKHPFGTDHLGRDIWSRLVFGIRLSLLVSCVSVILASALGTFIGAISSYIGGWVDNIVMRVMDTMLAFPSIIFALLLRLVLGAGLNSLVLTLTFVYVPILARTVRGTVLVEREKLYVLAARCIGRGSLGIVLRHILPNAVSPVMVLSTTLFANAIIVESSLSFIGVGIPISEPSLGTMLNDSMRFMEEYPYMAVFPGLAISLIVSGVNLLCHSLQDILEPKMAMA